jgi:hypothetical protein
MADTGEIENVFKVKLEEARAGGSASSLSRVVFHVTPDLIENQNVMYKMIDPVHAPGQMYAFEKSSSRTFNIGNAMMVSRTVKEADRNLRYLWMLRGWTKPAFGASRTGQDSRDTRDRMEGNAVSGTSANGLRNSATEAQERSSQGSNYTDIVQGQPPRVLLLTAYSNGQYGVAQHINKVPVVISVLTIPYPTDVDYIYTTSGIPMPTIQTLDISLIETHSPVEYLRFNLGEYRRGVLRGF